MLLPDMLQGDVLLHARRHVHRHMRLMVRVSVERQTARLSGLKACA
jgi:hypothetical protein